MIKITHSSLDKLADEYAKILTKGWKRKRPKDIDLFINAIKEDPNNLIKSPKQPLESLVKGKSTYEYRLILKKYKIEGKETTLAAWLVQKLGLTVCPYCNHDYILTRDPKNGVGRAQLDHYFPKKKYPHLALSFYNLIPSCPTCNRLKGEEKISLNPYEGGIENSYLFVVTNLVEFFLLEDETQVELVKNTSYHDEQSLDPNENIKIFQINELYSQHEPLVRDLLTKAQAYQEGYYESLRDNFKELGIGSNKDLDRLIFGNYVAPEDFGKQPLSKFTRDILLQLGIDLS